MEINLVIQPSLQEIKISCFLWKSENRWSFSLKEEGYSNNLRHQIFYLSSPQAREVEEIFQETCFPHSGNYKALGLDGTDFVLKVENGLVQEYYWWCELPTELAELAPLFHLLLRFGGLSLDDYL